MVAKTAYLRHIYTTRSNELRRVSYRDRLRHVALNGLGWWNSKVSYSSSAGGPIIQFLVLHHVFEDEVTAFRGMLARLRQSYHFVSYSEAVTRILEQRIDRKYLAVSFDDGLKCCLQAADILAEFGLRACFFVCPKTVGETNVAIVARFCRERLSYPPVEFLDWNDVERLVGSGHEIGGHTMNHVNLGQLTPTEAEDEIGDTYRTLCARLGAAQHFAWPYGRFADIHRDAARAVFGAGFTSCASGVRGCHGREMPMSNSMPIAAAQLCLRRDSVVVKWPAAHISYFLNRAARRPLVVAETWPPTLAPFPTNDAVVLCTSPSMPYRSSRVAG